ncbi:MAG: sugar transferase [Candidatus Nanopelagicales bacterium]
MSVKRGTDLALAGAATLVLSPVLVGVGVAIWSSDRGSPFYSAYRVGLRGQRFKMMKFRSMVLNADKLGPSSTGSRDPRITSIGRVMRATKVDELPQLINVLRGEMSIVGPRPQLAFEVASYSAEERRLLDVRPGISDLASVVFADEGEILACESDPDLAYEQLIRPWKSRLGLFYVDHGSVWMDVMIIGLTVTNSLSRKRALDGVQWVLRHHGADGRLQEVARRDQPLVPTPPPGLSQVIMQVPPSVPAQAESATDGSHAAR